jgi:hypothetical protein
MSRCRRSRAAGTWYGDRRMTWKGFVALLALSCVLNATHASPQGVRSRIRPKVNAITASQASDLTLTLTEVAVRPVQVWVRTAGSIDSSGKIVRVSLPSSDATRVRAGQRARVFPVDSRSSMYQARVIRVVQEGTRAKADVELAANGRTTSGGYIVEIVTEPGDFLSVPNEAIIEEGDGGRVVYVQTGEGQYEPRKIATGMQGERYTQVTNGVKQGDQVVTFGSFFIDSDYKLKGAAQVGSR